MDESKIYPLAVVAISTDGSDLYYWGTVNELGQGWWVRVEGEYIDPERVGVWIYPGQVDLAHGTLQFWRREHPEMTLFTNARIVAWGDLWDGDRRLRRGVFTGTATPGGDE